MKKLAVFLLAMLCAAATALGAANIEHTVDEANIRFKTLPDWSKKDIASTPAASEPGWTVTLSKEGAPGKQSPVSILIVDGRKNEAYQYMSVDFQGKGARNLSEQIIQDNRVQQSQKGYQINDYRLAKIGKINFLIIKSENPRQKILALQAITFLNNYSYTIATKTSPGASPQEIKTITENFDLIIKSLQVKKSK